jgi:hypothetical protein
LKSSEKKEDGGGGGGEGDMGGAGADMGGVEPSGSEPPAGEGEKGGDAGADDTSKPTGGESKPAAPKLAERDQTGRKDASKYRFGEDPLGTLENNRRSDLSVTHKYKNKSPLSLESLRGLTDMLNTVEDEKQILREGEEKSFMDERNIKE